MGKIRFSMEQELQQIASGTNLHSLKYLIDDYRLNYYSFPTPPASSQHEFSDLILQDCGTGIRGGGPGGNLDSEVTILRTTFLRHSHAGIAFNSFNALDYWISDSVYNNNYYGATNVDRAGTGKIQFC